MNKSFVPTIGGIPAEEFHRREALPSRPLTPEDVPNHCWRRSDDGLMLREDGVILYEFRGKLSWVGQLDGKGGIAFDMA